MFFKPHQLIIAASAGLITAGVVAYRTIQPQTDSMPLPDNETLTTSALEPKSTTELPPTTPSPSPSRETIAVNPMSINPPTSGCPIQMAVVDDPAPPLNVRSTPEVRQGNIVGQLENNTFLLVLEQQNGWLRIRDPIAGWVAQNLTRSSCAQVVQSIDFLPNRNQAVIQGEIIGSGSHRYTFEGQVGQTLRVESRNSIFPQIITPDAAQIARDTNQQNRGVWTGQLPITGQYTLELNSNFRGFEYDFWVQLE
ncbi:MAG: SH3 domain-containing protein [Microcoleaceae cyanobacterium]